MINLQRFFINHFNTGRVSNDNLFLFADDHKGRLTSNNPGGIYNVILNSLTNALNDYAQARSGYDTASAQQQGKTILMNAKMNDFINEVQAVEGLIRYTYRNNPEIYEEFFPQGLNEYGQASLGIIETLMDRIVDRFTAHVGDFPPAPNYVTVFSGLRTAFNNARDAQLALFGTTEGQDSLIKATRDVLEIQLMVDLLIVASNNIGLPHVMSDYFDQSIIRKPGEDEEGALTGTVAANTTVNIESEGIAPTTIFSLKNPGSTDLRFLVAPDATSTSPDGVILHPTQEVEVTHEMLGGGANTFLNVTNLSATEEGSWEAEVV